LDPLLGSGNVPFLTLLITLVFLGWYAGLALALGGVILGGVATAWLVLPGSLVPHSQNAAAFAVYLLVGAACAGLGHFFRKSQQREAAMRRAYDAADERLRQLASILDATSDFVAIGGLDGGVRYINPAGRDLVGIPRDADVALYQHAQLCPDWVFERTQQEWLPIALREGAVAGEGALLTLDGREIPVSFVMVAHRNAAGEVEALSTIARDIRAQREAEAKLRSSETLHRTIGEAVPDFVWMADAQGKAEFVNRKWIEYTGLSAEALNTVGWAAINHPEDQERLQAGWAEASRLGEPFEAEFRYRRHDGVYRWFWGRAVPVRDAQGQISKWVGSSVDIHDRRQTEESLRESEQRLRLALEGAGIGMWANELATGITQCTPFNLQLFGLPPDAPPPTPEAWLALIHEHDRPAVLRAWETALAGHGDYRIEYRVAQPDGSVRWLDSRARVYSDSAGTPLRMIGITLDVSERKWNELHAQFLMSLQPMLLKTRDPREVVTFALQALAQHLAVRQAVFSVLSADGDRALVQYEHSDGVPSVLGEHRLEEFIGEDARVRLLAGEAIAVSDVGADVRTAAHAANFARYGVTAFLSVPVLGEQGLTAVVAVHAAAARRWRGDEVQLLRSVAGRLVLALERARAEEKILRLADAMPQMVWIADASGQVTYFNRQWYAYTECAATEALGYGWLASIHPEDRDRTLQGWQAALVQGGLYEMEHRLRSADGSYRWFLSRAARASGSTPGESWFGTSTDIEEQRRAKASLEEADRRKDEFLATLAHELRNPLAPLTTSLQVLKLDKTTPETVEHVRVMMERQVQHMVRLVDDLLDVSRISRGLIRLRKRRLPVSEVVSSAVETSAPLIRASRHTLEVDVPSEPIHVEADPVRLGQILTNLLNNAARYTEPGGRIRLSVAKAGSEVAITVEDNGIGIVPHVLPHIFELFTQADTAVEKSKGGLGIGLTIAKKLAELHNGRLEAHSDGPGRGSRFVLRLPMGLHLVTDTSSLAAEAAAQSAPTGYRVVVADDNRDAADSLALMLRLFGHDVTVAHDGVAALELTAQHRPHVVLLDIGMPKLNGYEVCRQLRLQPGGEARLVIALTGWGQTEDKARAHEAGFDLHLVKPVDVEKLLGAIAANSRLKADGRVG
jgi:PAS domain S-box-containing protein